MGDVDNGIDGVEVILPESHSEFEGRHRDRHQVNDWNMFKGGTGHDEAEQGQEEGRERTGVDCKQEERKPQEKPTLVRTQDPSTPDDDAISYDILKSNSRRWVSSREMLADDVRVRVLCGLHGTDVDEKNAAEHHQPIWYSENPFTERARGGVVHAVAARRDTGTDELKGEDDGKGPINRR